MLLKTEEVNHRMLKENGEDDGEDSESTVDSEEDNNKAFSDLMTSEKSRYFEDFVEICCLGKGGFGRVFKAQNKLDGRMYAIKKIRFSSIYSLRYQRIVREVKSLALMDHPNIVRYNAAWIEESHEGATNHNNKKSTKALKDDSSENNFDPTIETATDEMDQNGPEKADHPLAMYIQMELCQYTLSEWISRRNSLLFNGSKRILDEFPAEYYRMVCSSISGTIDINVHEIRRIFKGIVKGLQYIHSQGLIHRDLKPQNIFFHGTDHIPKIGDFGLVSCNQTLRECEWSPPNSPGSESSSVLTSGLGTRVVSTAKPLSDYLTIYFL